MNPFLIIYIVSTMFVFLLRAYETYVNYKRGYDIRLTSDVLGTLLVSMFPVLNTLSLVHYIFCMICDNHIIIKGKK